MIDQATDVTDEGTEQILIDVESSKGKELLVIIDLDNDNFRIVDFNNGNSPLLMRYDVVGFWKEN